MGLDMFLNAKHYLSSYNEADKSKKAEIVKLFPELNAYLQEDSNPINEVTAEIGYWRKANHIHAWFVESVQNGEDDCRSYHVSREQLQELKTLCEQILANRSLAEELLPTSSGFFFGSTDYDDFYFSDLEETVEILNKAFALPDDWSIEYQSSW